MAPRADPSLPLAGRAAQLARGLPPLLARAEHLAANVALGEHGRRRPGLGEAFWQYRAAAPGDPVGMIDWRRSARSDRHFVQEKEWQAAQSVTFWVDQAASMRFASAGALEPKAPRAALLALATALLLVRAGERVALAGDLPGAPELPPAAGRAQLTRMAEALTRAEAPPPEALPDYGAPTMGRLVPGSRGVLVSDFLGDLAGLEAALAAAAAQGVGGVLLQVLDPAEEGFPFRGATRFQSMAGGLAFETRQAEALRPRYLARLAARKAELERLARAAGWQVGLHHTSRPAQEALLWLSRALEARP